MADPAPENPPADSRPLRIGLVSISDRASRGIYEDLGIPALKDWFATALASPWSMVTRLIPDERPLIEAALKELVDVERCDLVLTTGGTGPAKRDVTPEATLAVGDREMPGFGEQMRQISLRFVPTAILSRQVAVIRGEALIINLPGQPKSIRESLHKGSLNRAKAIRKKPIPSWLLQPPCPSRLPNRCLRPWVNRPSGKWR